MVSNNDAKSEVLFLLRQKRIALARQSFYEFCKIMNPDFYSPNKTYLKTLCDTLQALYEGKLLKKDGTPYKNISINLPP